MNDDFKPFDPVDNLKTEEDRDAYFKACLDEDPGDGSLIEAALRDIERSREKWGQK